MMMFSWSQDGSPIHLTREFRGTPEKGPLNPACNGVGHPTHMNSNQGSNSQAGGCEVPVTLLTGLAKQKCQSYTPAVHQYCTRGVLHGISKLIGLNQPDLSVFRMITVRKKGELLTFPYVFSRLLEISARLFCPFTVHVCYLVHYSWIVMCHYVSSALLLFACFSVLVYQ